MDQIFVFVSGEDSKGIFPGNNPTGFTVQLLRLIDLKGSWIYALTEMYLDNKLLVTPTQVILWSDLIEESYICDT